MVTSVEDACAKCLRSEYCKKKVLMSRKLLPDEHLVGVLEVDTPTTDLNTLEISESDAQTTPCDNMPYELHGEIPKIMEQSDDIFSEALEDHA